MLNVDLLTSEKKFFHRALSTVAQGIPSFFLLASGKVLDMEIENARLSL